jgi:hypothetical protein
LISFFSGVSFGGVRIARAATLTVNSLSDDATVCAMVGTVCLRGAVAAAHSGDVIQFGVAGILNLTRGVVNLNRNLTLQGMSGLADQIASNSQMFTISSGVSAQINDLILGYVLGGTADGGAIYNAGTVALNGTLIVSATAGRGAGLFNAGTATVNSSGFGSNGATNGGAIYNAGTLTFVNSTTSGNYATAQGGALYNAANATALISNSTLDRDTADGNGGMIANYGKMTVANTTLSHTWGNSLNGSVGWAIWNATTGATLNLGSSIVAFANVNTSEIDVSGPIVSIGYNLVANGDGSTGLVNGVS